MYTCHGTILGCVVFHIQQRAMDDMDTMNMTLCNHQRRRKGNVLSEISSMHVYSPRCRVHLLSSPVLRLVLLLFFLASVVEPAAVDHRPAAGYEHGRVGPLRYHNRQLINGQLETWQVARCRQHDHYVACFLCGKIVQSQEVYYGCCHMHTLVMEFCDKLLAWQHNRHVNIHQPLTECIDIIGLAIVCILLHGKTATNGYQVSVVLYRYLDCICIIQYKCPYLVLFYLRKKKNQFQRENQSKIIISTTTKNKTCNATTKNKKLSCCWDSRSHFSLV